MQNEMLDMRIYFNLTRAHFLCSSLVMVGSLKMSSSDRKALLALYRATGGLQWDNNRGWGTDAGISSWYGVEVRDSRVVKLHLGWNNLQGNAPSHRL